MNRVFVSKVWLWPLGAFLVSGFQDVAVAEAYAEKVPWVGESLQGRVCSSFPKATQGFTGGGLDYTRYAPSRKKLRLVEEYHFTPKVKNLKGGEHGSTPLEDLNYTLRAFPNHYEALYSIIRYFTEKIDFSEKSPMWKERHIPPECYLQKAINFRQEDAKLRVLFGIYLHRVGEIEKARELYKKSVELKSDYAEGYYNLGLLLTDMGEYQKARKVARKAYELGYPLSGLRDRLKDKGYPL